jgi:hypothetical protein
MPSNYVIWTRDIVPGACALSGMTGFADDWKLIYGEPIGDALPSSARFAMDPDSRRDVMLTDNLYNGDMLIVASARLRDLVAARKPAAIDYLVVPIFNHKKRAIAEPYCIVHPLAPIDCLVIDECKPEWGRINKKAIERVERLVIDETRIPEDRLLFRPDLFCSVILAHRSLADAIDTAGMTGVRWVELADYPEV